MEKNVISAVNMILLPHYWLNGSNSLPPPGSFHEKDNRSTEQQELMKLRKRNKQLEMENDILK